MTENIDWTEWAAPTGDFPERFRFEATGDSITGEIVRISVATMPDGARLPALEIRDDNGTTWSILASQRALQAALSAHRPATGDRIAVVYTGDAPNPKPGRSAAKLFDVALNRHDSPVQAVAQAPAVQTAPTPSADSLI